MQVEVVRRGACDHGKGCGDDEGCGDDKECGDHGEGEGCMVSVQRGRKMVNMWNAKSK